MSNKIFIPKKKNPKWQPPKTGPGIRQQMEEANKFSYDQVKIEDIEKVLMAMDAQTKRTGALYTNNQGLSEIDKAIKKAWDTGS